MRKQEVDFIFSRMLDAGTDISDLNITVGKPFQVESSGSLKPVLFEPKIEKLTPFQTEALAMSIIGRDRRLLTNLLETGSCDCSYEIPGKARFRVNIFSQRGNYSIILRRLGTSVPTLKELGLPEAFYKMAKEKNGIILVTGATGSGKTTSLSALLEEINETESVHIITLEDPIEFTHSHKKATFNQREMGLDFDTFANGLRSALRQAPKVILVGEMRDRESVEIALSASETGHLVLSTIHTIDAGQTINRIIGIFEKDEELQIRTRLADSMRWIVSQKLLPKTGGGRVACIEIMQNNLRVKEVIQHGESEGKTFYEIIQAARPFGMITFDDAMIDLYKTGQITEETAGLHATYKGYVGRGIDSVKSSRGEATTDLGTLEVDLSYGRTKKKL